MDKQELMKLAPLFLGLSEAEQKIIAEQFTTAECKTGTPLFSTGEQSDALFLVGQGFVRLETEGGQSLATLGAGSILGESSLFRGKPYDVSAVAMADVQYWRLTDRQLRNILLEHPSIGIQLSQNSGGLLNQMDDFLVQLLSKSDELGNLPQHALEAIAKRLEPVIIEAGQVVCRAGEVPQGLFLIELGSVELRPEASVKGEPPETLSSGSILGAAPLLTNKAYAYSVTAVGPGRMWRLSADDFQAISSRNPGLRRSLGRSVRSQLGRADQAQAASRLAGMPLFEQLPQPIIEAIVQRMVLQHAPAGERIFRIGDSGDAIYFIENGEVELTAENRSGVVEELARVGDEGFFGEQSLITGQIRTEDATATRNTNLWVLYKSDLDSLSTQYPVIGKALSDAISTRLSAEDTDVELSRFREFPLLADFSEEDLRQIVPYFEPDRYRTGDQILRASTPAEKLFLIDRGQVRVQPFNGGSWILGPGQAFGERALLSNQPNNSTVFAESDVDVWTLSKSDFDTLLARYPSLALNISRMMSDQLDQQSAPMAGQPMAPDARYAPPQPGMPADAQQRQQYATDPVGGESPRRRGGFGQWYGNLSGRGKVLFALLVLLVIWLIAVAAPSAVVSVMRGAGLVDDDGTIASTNRAVQAVYKLGSYDVAALDSDMAQAVSMADNQIAPTATYTPYPTATFVPTATPLPTNTPLPPTATPTPAPVAFVAAPVAAPVVEEAPPEPEVQAASAPPRIWDGRLEQLGVYVEDAQVEPGQPYWRVIEAQFWDEQESGGKHHIYVEVLDENGDRIVGHPVTVFWGDGSHTGNIEDKNPPDLGFNYQMYASGYAYSVKVEGLPSEIVKGAGMGDIENRFMGIHTSYLLTYKKTIK